MFMEYKASRLQVCEVKHLPIVDLANNEIYADCSITPDNVGANTYNTAIAIGEKAAVLIAEDLGIKGVTSA